MKKRVLLTVIIASLAISAAACGKKNTSSSETSTGSSTVTESQTQSTSAATGSSTDSTASGESSASSSSESTTSQTTSSANSSASDNTTTKTYTAASEVTDAEYEAMHQMLEYVYATAEVGTAGSSLKCADAAGYVLEWSESNTIDPETVKSDALDYITGAIDDASEFKDLMDATYDQVLVLAKGDDNAKQLLKDAGMDKAYDFPWNNKDLDVIKAVKDAADSAG